MSRTVILDSEPVQALMSETHPKHTRALAQLQVVAARKGKGSLTLAVVPTAVRVEAGWDRRAPQAALVNRLRIRDVVLDDHSANVAAAILTAHGVSVADAHIGAVISVLAGTGPITLVTSDPDDMRIVAKAHAVTVVRL